MNPFHRSAGWLLRLLVLGAAVAVLASCSHDYWARFHILTSGPGVVVNRDVIQVPLGYAVAVRATPMKDDKELDEDVEVDLVSLNQTVLGLDHGVRDHEFVIWGAREGRTSVDVYVGGSYGEEIDAIVVPPN